MVSAPSWLHRFIIGKKGQNLAKITQQMPKVCESTFLRITNIFNFVCSSDFILIKCWQLFLKGTGYISAKSGWNILVLIGARNFHDQQCFKVFNPHFLNFYAFC